MSNYNQSVSGVSRFLKSPVAELEYSRMRPTPTHYTTMNAGDIVPIYCAEVLPHETLKMDLDFVIRQTTSLTPVMGSLTCDFFAFFVPNRIVNQSWKNVQGENTSGSWIAPEVSLAPLYKTAANAASSVQVPVGSVADYYGFPTQQPIPSALLQQCHDLKFRGYLEIYNNFFRSQDYQPPIAYSKLNVYEGFFEPVGSYVSLDPESSSSTISISRDTASDGSSPGGALMSAVYGENADLIAFNSRSEAIAVFGNRNTTFSALESPLKANKRHDLFTSVLPSPQKGAQVKFALGGTIPVKLDTAEYDGAEYSYPLVMRSSSGQDGMRALFARANTTGSSIYYSNVEADESSIAANNVRVVGTNLTGSVDLSSATSITVEDLRHSFALQHTYEALARGGSRYRELLASFFELDTIDAFPDVPTLLGRFSRELDMYQTAQTSASSDGSTPQGNLTAYGYTNSGGSMFEETFLEHGYVHVFAVIRHHNIYSSGIARDNFRLDSLDFYLPTLANISEQPVYTRELNAFVDDPEGVLGYNEAWYEYREEPDYATGLMRTGVDGSLGEVWTYADGFDPAFVAVNGDWLKSNSKQVVDRSLAVTSEPQFRCQFVFKLDKQLPMPTYSVPGLDTL